MLLIGSLAARMNWPKFRVNKDIDLITTQDEFEKFVKNWRHTFTSIKTRDEKRFRIKIEDYSDIEVEIVTGNDAKYGIMERNKGCSLSWWDGNIFICNQSDLLLIKSSHINQRAHWQKNIKDYYWMKARTKFDKSDPLYLKLVEETELRYGKFKCKTDIINEEFFKRSEKIGRIYEHDDIHLAIAHYDRPLYERCKPDLNKAYISQKMFKKLSFEDQLRMVQEECYVIAIERRLLTGQTNDQNQAYLYGLERICTDLTSGWFRDFAIEHAIELWLPDVNYFHLFQEKIDAIRHSKTFN